ncbi:hypothetical protein SUDANB178_04171 [Streptomyces sp. enrichment culture]
MTRATGPEPSAAGPPALRHRSSAAGPGSLRSRPLGLRLVQKATSTRLFAKVAPRMIPALDRAVHRLTGGRVLLSARTLPGVILTSTGARSDCPAVPRWPVCRRRAAAGC